VTEPLVEEALRVRMTAFLQACRDAGYTRLAVDAQDYATATWDPTQSAPANMAMSGRPAPALWALMDRHYGLGNGNVGHLHHSAQARGARARMIAGVYNLLGDHWL
jgi:hypothetical protein